MNENTIRFILLLVGATIILGILWDGLRRKKRRLLGNNEQEEIRQTFEEEEDEEEEIDLLENEFEDEEQDPTKEEEFEESEVDDAADDDETDELEADELEQDQLDEAPAKPSKKPDFISIRLMAKTGQIFGGYNLLQFLLANRLDCGEMKLFHRFADENKKEKLFSLASVNEPGDFELSKMNDFECDGLILYMHPGQHQNPLAVFDMMLETAYDLVHDLRGELMSGKNQPWTDDTSDEIREALS